MCGCGKNHSLNENKKNCKPEEKPCHDVCCAKNESCCNGKCCKENEVCYNNYCKKL
jgi:hypothetical protein